ncbi:MAG: GGDEF domain-containing protein [Gammaproteobacteria bacterium]|jgi:diguanylate cyclase (GGDEF)-like protein
MSVSIPDLQSTASRLAETLTIERTADPSQRDELTGFATQDYFTGRLDNLMQSDLMLGADVTLVLLQLANFYQISSWVGSSEARLLLTRLAGLLKDAAPDHSWLCRCRGHEFALLLVDEGSRRFPEFAETIHQVLHRQTAHLVPPQLSLACGIGSVRLGADTPNSAIAFARARHNIWQRQLSNMAAPALFFDTGAEGMDRHVEAALAENRFRLSFQGIIGFRDNSLQRYETRITLLDGEAQRPARAFMDAAVKSALGEKLDRWVFREAIRTLKAEPDPRCRLTVNVSQNSLVSPGFLDWLAARLTTDLAPRLVLQVSEIDILITQHHLDRFCQRARTLKLGLSINHFGAVEDPFPYLTLFPADSVKLHRSRLQQLPESPERRQQLAALVGRLHDQSIAVVAATVEKFSDLPLLWQAGVDFVQGHSLHRPSSSRDCEFVEEIELRLE